LQFGLWGIGDELFSRLRDALRSVGANRKGNTGTVSGTSIAGPGAEQTFDNSADNEIHRSLASSWLKTDPLGRLIVMRVGLETLRLYQDMHTQLSCQSRRQSMTIQDLLVLDGEPSELKSQVPFYKLVSGDVENAAIERVKMLLNEPTLWLNVLPDSYKSIELQELAFRILVGIGSLLTVKLLRRRKEQPLRTFQVDLDPTVEQRILGEECEHLHTPWSAKHAQQHFGEADGSKAHGLC
jgi:hypothetical protein